MSLSLKDAIFRYERKGDKGIYVFWSKDWASSKPWTYDGDNVRYFDKLTLDRALGNMVTWFVGPLCVIRYDVRK